MSLDQDIYDGGEVGWLRVQSRSEATRKSKEQQRDHILNGAELFSQTPPAPKAPLDTISNPYRDLVGAPLRKRLPTQRFDTDSHHGLRNRVGGILHLPPDHPLPSQKTSGDAQSTELTFDYSDEQWPSMGSGNVVPQLTSWSTVVKKPPPPSQGPPTSGTSKVCMHACYCRNSVYIHVCRRQKLPILMERRKRGRLKSKPRRRKRGSH